LEETGSRVAANVPRSIVHLLREIENFLRMSDVPPARFGRQVMGDPRFVFDLRNGREPRPRTVARIRRFLEAGQ
jgi:hypothetical protein